MDKILVSACLLGDRCRYDGEGGDLPILHRLQKKYDLVPFCPEVEAGLPVPRSPAEILRGKVVSKEGKDLTAEYESSARKAVRLCSLLGIHMAILKESSPACGPRKIHDGTFHGGKVPGMGVTARALVHAGVKVYSDEDALDFLLEEREERKESFLRGKKEARERKPSYGKRKKEEEGALFRLSPGKEGERKAHPSGKGKPFRKKSADAPSRKESFGGMRKDPHAKRRPYGKKAPFARKDGSKEAWGKDEGRTPQGRKDFHGKKAPYGKKGFSPKRSHKDGAMRPQGKEGSARKAPYGKKGFRGKGRPFPNKGRKREG